jgi:hypothetical protein
MGGEKPRLPTSILPHRGLTRQTWPRPTLLVSHPLANDGKDAGQTLMDRTRGCTVVSARSLPTSLRACVRTSAH